MIRTRDHEQCLPIPYDAGVLPPNTEVQIGPMRIPTLTASLKTPVLSFKH